MNIFKVLASGRKSFSEETASALITWFMHPAMEHGLGYTFLSKFIQKLSELPNVPRSFCDLTGKLTSRMRSTQDSQLTLHIDLEYNVGAAVIDIIFEIDDWILAIENKIYLRSISTGQIMIEYEFLKKKRPEKHIAMIYLVPLEENTEILPGKIEAEFAKLSVQEGDFKAITTWQQNTIGNTVSISGIINEILTEESLGIIDPISEYTRHTLKALNAFIGNNFAGYEYERSIDTHNINPLTEDVLSIDNLRTKTKGFVGVKDALQGLLKMDKDSIRKHKFQYTSQDMSGKKNWVDIYRFNRVLDWLLYNNRSPIQWEGVFWSESLYCIAESFGNTVFIGIRGGEQALRQMTPADIQSKKWQISMQKATSQWIDGATYSAILKEKGVFSSRS